jgi:hypothetical protein
MDADPGLDRILVGRHPSRKDAPPIMPAARLLRFAALCVAASAPLDAARRTAGAELLSAAHAGIRATDAGRHVAVLADDSFEGREGGSRGGHAAGSYIVEQLQPLGLEPAGDDGSCFQRFGQLRNIPVLLRGSDPRLERELVVVGAHYDHVGYGKPANSFGPFGMVHNGADDNASGVAGLLEIAAAVQQLSTPPRRSILLAFWDGEEQGLLGSRHFLRVRPLSVAGMRIVFSVNLDMIGRLRDRRLEVFGTRSASGLRSAVVAANNDPANAAGLDLFFDWDCDEDSDHYPFIHAGVPTVMFHTGLHDQYHRPADDVHLVNLDGIEPVSRLALGFLRSIADADAVPAFRPQALGESNASRRGLELVATDAVATPRGRWGIVTRADPAEPAAPVVVRVAPGSPASAGGMLPGDRLLAIDGASVAGQDDMVARLKAAATEVSIDIERRGRFAELRLRSPEPAMERDGHRSGGN